MPEQKEGESLSALEALNFVEQKENNFIQDIFDWTITSGRKVIIFTEIIVLAVFLSRFYFDRKLHDVKLNIEDKQAIIESSYDIEIEHRRIQTKLEFLKSVLDAQIDWRNWLDNFTKKIPATLVLNQVILNKQTATISAIAKTPDSFAIFISILLQDEDINSVILTQSSFDKETKEYEFTMELDLKDP